MASTRYRSDGDGWWTLRDLLKRDEAFHNTTGNLRGVHHNPDAPLPSKGRMDIADSHKMNMVHDMYGVNYIIYSFQTPIAYRDTHGKWIVPDAGYSAITKSKHLSRVRPAIAQIMEEKANA